MATVQQYWPGDFYAAINGLLVWLYGRQGQPTGLWLANALFSLGPQTNLETVEPSGGLIECGISSLVNFLTGLTAGGAEEAPMAMAQIESITLSMPPGYYGDNQLGPDGYPINTSAVGFGWGPLIANSILTTLQMENQVRGGLYNAGSTAVTPGPPQTGGVTAKWKANTCYAQFAMIVDSNNNVQMALYNGTTANSSNAPNWPTGAANLGALTGDGTQVWKFITQNYATIGPVATGFVFNLLNPAAKYRVDLFSWGTMGEWQYVGSSGLQTAVLAGAAGYSGAYTFSVANVGFGQLLAVLYPTSVSQPVAGWGGSAIPAGWVAHSNTGVAGVPQPSEAPGGKLSAYKAQIYSYNSSTGIETLLEDNIPIIVQPDGFHARAGGSQYWAAGATPTVHILYNDPVVGWTQVYSTLQGLPAFEDLPRSYQIPINDPLYTPNPTGAAAMQNRAKLMDCALATIAYAASGNIATALLIVAIINTFLSPPAALGTTLTPAASTPVLLTDTVLENGTNGTANWSCPGGGGSVSLTAASAITPPPPASAGATNVITLIPSTRTTGHFANYVGSALPDAVDSTVSFTFYPTTSVWQLGINIQVSTGGGPLAPGYIVIVQPTALPGGLSGRVGLKPSYNSAAGTFTYPVPIINGWYTIVINLAQLVAQLAPQLGQLTSISGLYFYCPSETASTVYVANALAGIEGQNLLPESIDAYNGQADQLTINTAAQAWMIYAYCAYMQTAQDTSQVYYLQAMVTAILQFQSHAADLTNGMFYQGYGSYSMAGIFSPGLTVTARAKDQPIIWMALSRAALALANAASNLQKTNQITAAQATSLNATANQATAAAALIWPAMLNSLYVAPAGTTAGHFAQGVTGATVDPSLSLDAQTQGAILADANGRDDIAEQCLEFAFATFVLSNQTVAESSAPESYNETFSGSGPYEGLEPYADSTGGYTNAPASIDLQSTWMFIHALLRFYYDTTLQAYFSAQGTSIDAVLTTLVSAQSALMNVAQGGMLMDTLAERQNGFNLYVWPAVSPTAWAWLTATNPNLLMSVNGQPQVLEWMQIPAGAEQSFDDRQGSSSLGQMEVKCIDPGGLLHKLAAQEELIGQVVSFSMGFPGMALGDFAPLHIMQISSVDFDEDGRVVFKLADLKRFTAGAPLWANGGPNAWTPGTKNTYQPPGAQWLANGSPVSSNNPRFISGNPLDIFLAALQNELGVGQDIALAEVPIETAAGELAVAANPFWQKYTPAPPIPITSIATGTGAGGVGGTATLESIAIAPANPAVTVGTVLGVSATGTYSDGSTVNITAQVTWSVSPATVAVMPSPGVVKAVATGTATIGASLSGVTGTTQLTVVAARSTIALASIAQPAAQTTGLAASLQAAIIGTIPSTVGNQATLINPNPYVDVPGITALRDSLFSGFWFEFKITSPQQGRSWLEEQILKPLGLVMVVTSTGQITLKSMQPPANQTPAASFTAANIVGIPSAKLAPIINGITFRGDVDNTITNISARTYNSTVSFLQQASFNLLRYLYNHQVEASGVVTVRGLFLMAFLLGDQLMRRYAFGSPIYEATLQLGSMQPELKDWVALTHPLVTDYVAGARGVSNVPCEVIGRSPDYANGTVRYSLLDMRRALNYAEV